MLRVSFSTVGYRHYLKRSRSYPKIVMHEASVGSSEKVWRIGLHTEREEVSRARPTPASPRWAAAIRLTIDHAAGGGLMQRLVQWQLVQPRLLQPEDALQPGFRKLLQCF